MMHVEQLNNDTVNYTLPKQGTVMDLRPLLYLNMNDPAFFSLVHLYNLYTLNNPNLMELDTIDFI